MSWLYSVDSLCQEQTTSSCHLQTDERRVCGRTEASKTTIAMTLLRIVELIHHGGRR
jgi:hypothetical protein